MSLIGWNTERTRYSLGTTSVLTSSPMNVYRWKTRTLRPTVRDSRDEQSLHENSMRLSGWMYRPDSSPRRSFVKSLRGPLGHRTSTTLDMADHHLLSLSRLFVHPHLVQQALADAWYVLGQLDEETIHDRLPPTHIG